MDAEASMKGPRRRSLAPLVIFAAAFVAILVTVAFVFVFRLYNVPSSSNVPTLRVGDVIIGSKLEYGISRFSLPVDLGFRGRLLGHAPKRGDMTLFVLPSDSRTVYIKRVIGLPGDKVQVKEGRLYLNGIVVEREPVAKIRTEGYTDEMIDAPTYREILPDGASYTIVEVQGDTGFNDNTDVFTVPPDNYFVLGDNRDNSLDSRIAADQGGVGFVPLDNFLAKAEFVFYNLTSPERALKPIR